MCMQIISTILIGLGSILAVTLGYLALGGEAPPLFEGSPQGGVCTLDAKLCPDGSYVGRVPPNCEFAMCPVVTSTPLVP